MTQVFRDGKVHVRASECDACLFKPTRIVPGSRAAQIVRDTKDVDGATFSCHKSQTEGEPETICAGWWERFAHNDMVLRFAVALGAVEKVESSHRTNDEEGPCESTVSSGK